MTDRKPRYPGRKLATIPAGEIARMNAGQEFSITLKRDDDPIVPGTPYNKASVLPNSLAAALCSDVLNPTPADAFRGLYKKGVYTYTAVLPVDSWAPDTQKDGYIQVASLTQTDGGPAITESTQLSEPMIIPTGDEDKDDETISALALIDTSAPGENTVNVHVRDLPDVDLTVYYYAKCESYDASEEGEYQHTAAEAAGEAEDSARAADKSAKAAKASEDNAKTSETTAGTAAIESELNATSAAASARSATSSSESAAQSAALAGNSAGSAESNAKLAEKSAADATAAAKQVTDFVNRVDLDTSYIDEAVEKAQDSADKAESSKTAAGASAQNAANSELAAAGSAAAALQDRQAADASASSASDSAAEASASQTAAAGAAQSASTNASAAAASAEAAGTSETNAEKYATAAQSYAVGGTETREGEETSNGKFFYEQIKRMVESVQGALMPMGTIPFSELAAVEPKPSHLYNISDAFTTDETFKEGSGHDYPAGTNVYRTADGFWDALSGVQVTGVKGEAEQEYHLGQVNITKESLGLDKIVTSVAGRSGPVVLSASDVPFADGETFQEKYDAGELTGPPGKDGTVGTQGPAGPAGPNTVSTTTASGIDGLLKGSGGMVAAAVAGTDYVAPSGLNAYAKLAGAAFTGAVTVPAPTASMHPATKQYVDSQISSKASATCSATFTAAKWTGNDTSGYTQSATAAGVTAATELGPPMIRPTGVQDTDEALHEALSVINDGVCTPGAGTVTAKVWDRPDIDITVYWRS